MIQFLGHIWHIRKIATALFIVLTLSITITPFSLAKDTAGKLALGVGWPYLSMKYGLSKILTIEGRGAFGSGIKAYGGRGYFNFSSGNKTILYAGVEADYISFDTEGVEGNGTLYMPFIGGEYFLSKKSSITLDFGPALINLKDSEKIVGEKTFISGWEWIINFGLYFYFGGIK